MNKKDLIRRSQIEAVCQLMAKLISAMPDKWGSIAGIGCDWLEDTVGDEAGNVPAEYEVLFFETLRHECDAAPDKIPDELKRLIPIVRYLSDEDPDEDGMLHIRYRSDEDQN